MDKKKKAFRNFGSLLILKKIIILRVSLQLLLQLLLSEMIRLNNMICNLSPVRRNRKLIQINFEMILLNRFQENENFKKSIIFIKLK